MAKRSTCKYSRNWQIELFNLAEDFMLNMSAACAVIDRVAANPKYTGYSSDRLYNIAYSGLRDLIMAR